MSRIAKWAVGCGCLTLAIVAICVAAWFILVFSKLTFSNPTHMQQQTLNRLHRSPQWSADGQFIVASIHFSLYAVSINGDSVQRIPKAADPGQFSPTLSSENILAYVDVTGRSPIIAATELEGTSDPSEQTTLGKSWDVPQWSPTGQHIAFSRQEKAQAIIADADGSVIARHKAPYDAIGKPAWSSDGKQVAFTWGYHRGCRQCTITVLNVDGSSETLVEHTAVSSPEASESEGTGLLSSAEWSQDGATLYYAFKEGDGRDTILFAINTYTNERKSIANLGNVVIRDIYLSHVENILIFVSVEPFMSAFGFATVLEKVNLLDIDQGHIDQIDIPNINVVSYPRGELHTSWSPDGSRIAILYNRDGMLIVMNADGSEGKLLTEYNSEREIVPAYAMPLQP